MAREDWEARWRVLSEEVLTGMWDWRTAHPRATFAEIEAAVDERLNRLRARMLEEVALASRAAQLQAEPAGGRPPCPECGQPLQPRGEHTRELTVQGDQTVRLRRSYAVCQACGAGLFPPG
jgi:hypothetical protein